MTIQHARDSLIRPQPLQFSCRGLLKAGLGLSALAGMPGATAYAAAEAANDLVVTRYKLSPSRWRAGQRLTITAIADTRRRPQYGHRARAPGGRCGQCARQRSDCGAGDYFATHRFVTEVVPAPAWAEELARLRAPLGVYSILGNHDWWYEITAVRKALAGVQLPLMENDAVLLGEPGRRFWLAGLGDQLAHYISPSQFRGVDDLPGTLKKIATDDPVILLVHEPDIFAQVPERLSLTIAGHTHGGQIRLPLLPVFWAPSQYGARFAYGHIVERGRHLIVSGGLGCSKVPLRLGVLPENLRIELCLMKCKRRRLRRRCCSARCFVYGIRSRASAASRGLYGESPWPGASTTTTVPIFTRL